MDISGEVADIHMRTDAKDSGNNSKNNSLERWMRKEGRKHRTEDDEEEFGIREPYDMLKRRLCRMRKAALTWEVDNARIRLSDCYKRVQKCGLQ